MSEKKIPLRRGKALREHILWSAKGVFLEMGFERASMDLVANRAGTSKRSLYAHFENKEKLFLAFLELMRGLFLGHLKTPGDYSEKPVEAIAIFCARYVEMLTSEPSVHLCRVSLAETARFPEGAAQHFDVVFAAVHARLNDYLKAAAGLSLKASVEATNRLLGQVLYPRFPRALFGIDPLAKGFNPDALSPDFDLDPIYKAVADVIGMPPEQQVAGVHPIAGMKTWRTQLPKRSKTKRQT